MAKDKGLSIDPIGKGANIVPEDRVKERVVIGEDITKDEDGKEQKIIFESIRYKGGVPYTPFDFAIVAKTADSDDVLGYAGMYDYTRHFKSIAPEIMEMEMLKVDPGYFRKGVGANLVLFAQLCTVLREKKLIARPERPGEMTVEECRGVVAPLDEDELRDMYKKLGFREFKKREVDELLGKMESREVSSNLLFAGFNSKTQEFGDKKYSITAKEIDEVSKIPFETRLKFWKEELTRRWGHANAYDSNRRSHKKIIEQYVIFDGEIPFRLAKKIKKITTRKPVYWKPRPIEPRRETRTKIPWHHI